MDSARPVGARGDVRPLASEKTVLPTGNFAGNSVVRGRFADARSVSGKATARLRPRYRDGDHRSAAGDGRRL